MGRWRRSSCARAAAALLATVAAAPSAADSGIDVEDARSAVLRVADLFADQLALDGGYVWAYSPDGAVRRAEGGQVEDGVNWNQPPGTPAIGGAFLRLYEITGDDAWREAAVRTVEAFLSGQLLSGGWYNFTETDAAGRARWCYRVEVIDGDGCKAIKENDEKNRTSLDDNITPSAIGFLLWYDDVTGGTDPAAREAAEFALERLLRAQYPNGAWPVYFERKPDNEDFAAGWRASIPEDWPREWTKPSSWPVFVINDHLVRDVVRMLIAAERYLGREDFLAAAVRSGDFLLAAQLPEPQRGWAQGYSPDLIPIWGRRFEPPAVASRETAGSIQALLDLYRRTGDERYLQGARDAAAWLRSVRRPSGDWARFYELGTDRPLFVREDETLSYEEDNLREGYGQVGTFGIEAVLEQVDRVAASEPFDAVLRWDWVFEPTSDADPRAALELVAEAADSEGRVLEDGWILSATFVDAVRALTGLPATH